MGKVDRKPGEVNVLGVDVFGSIAKELDKNGVETGLSSKVVLLFM